MYIACVRALGHTYEWNRMGKEIENKMFSSSEPESVISFLPLDLSSLYMYSSFPATPVGVLHHFYRRKS